MADGSQPSGQDEIEQLLQQAQAAGASESSASAEASPDGSSGASDATAKQPAAAGAAAVKPSAASGESEARAGRAAAGEKVQSSGPEPPAGSFAQDDIDYLLEQAESAIASIDDDPADALPPGVRPFQLDDFAGAPASADMATIDLVRDVELDLRIELGRTHMYLEDVLKLRKGSVVPLEKLAGDPVDVFVNGRLVARGEILVLNDNFCVRVAELIAGENVGTA